MAKELTWRDIELLVGDLFQKWFDIEGKCIDYKPRKSRKSSAKQDYWNVFDVMINDNNRTTWGVQVKHWSKDITKGQMTRWANKVYDVNFDYRYALMIVVVKGSASLNIHWAKDYLNTKGQKHEKRKSKKVAKISSESVQLQSK